MFPVAVFWCIPGTATPITKYHLRFVDSDGVFEVNKQPSDERRLAAPQVVNLAGHFTTEGETFEVELRAKNEAGWATWLSFPYTVGSFAAGRRGRSLQTVAASVHPGLPQRQAWYNRTDTRQAQVQVQARRLLAAETVIVDVGGLPHTATIDTSSIADAECCTATCRANAMACVSDQVSIECCSVDTTASPT